MSRAPINMGASVRDRLTAKARAQREDAQRLMIRYVIERLLYRLSRSPYRGLFVLKGADFAADKQILWRAFLARTQIALAPEPFPDVQARIGALVMASTAALVAGEAFASHWEPGGPWAVAPQA